MTTILEAMKKYMGEAIQAREKFYQGNREAYEGYANSTGIIAQQKWQSSPKGKELIGENRWNMMQAVMFGVAEVVNQVTIIANATVDMSCTLYDIKKILEAQNDGGQEPAARGTDRRRPGDFSLPRQGGGSGRRS